MGGVGEAVDVGAIVDGYQDDVLVGGEAGSVVEAEGVGAEL